MKKTSFFYAFAISLSIAGGLVGLGNSRSAHAATTPLADQPLLTSQVASNVMLDLSVEFPTALTLAHGGNFAGSATSASKPYLGYFDPGKCYTYGNGYFSPFKKANADRTCGGDSWSGHLLNWATMQAIDTFRWALTGGNRSTDLPLSFPTSATAPVGTTILERAWASGQDVNTANSSWTPRVLYVNADVRKFISTSDVGFAVEGSTIYIGNYIGNSAYGNMFRVADSDSSAKGNSQCSKRSCKEYYARVQVCVDGNFSDGTSKLEANCQKYVKGDIAVYKPVGLMQQYKNQMYFGAFGYLLTADNNRDGGVLRAKVQSVSPEILETGAFADDPYGFANAGLGILYSGSINYLNKFGSISRNYKTYDPVGEMYAESIKYFRALSPTPSYVSGITNEMRDGFPVFGDPLWTATGSAWNDPATDVNYQQYDSAHRPLPLAPLWCKKNYIIGIGDVRTHSDSNLSGMEGLYSVPPGVDAAMGTRRTAKSWTDAVGDLEGSSNLGAQSPSAVSGCCSGNSYLMAGIAYFAHSEDIRPTENMPGTQTVNTFWMDVLEGGWYVHRNQFWLAAKYGGYNKPKGSDPGPFNSSTDTWKSQNRVIRADANHNIVETGGTVYDLPDNYYPANTPDLMVAGLTSAFVSIASGSGVGAGAALSNPQVDTTTGGSLTFQGAFDAALWSGNVTARKIVRIDNDPNSSSYGQPVTTALWDAASKLDAITYSARKVVTLAPISADNAAPAVADLKGVPFVFSSLSNAQKLALSKTITTPAGDNTDGQRILNYLRGDRSNESTATESRLYRQRGSKLGDIGDSKIVYLGSKPSALYVDSYNPGYQAFVNATTRRPLVFVGANDGMLHAFDATDDATTGGNEIFALVPYAVFGGPDNNAEMSGIQALARKSYSHHYYVNATPEIRDVDFARAGGVTQSDSSKSDWRTLLVVGLGKGGKSFVAMDVTNISATLSEAEIASKVLWEFSNPDMGFSFGRPLIAKTKRWGWVVILTGGYNNVGGNTASGYKPGQGVIFVLDPRNGTLLQAIYTGEGSESDPLGLAQVEGYTQNYQDYTLEYVYGGDLKGNMWRFDFTDGSRNVPAPTKIAQFKGPDGVVQPITVAPKIEYAAEGLKRYVFVGTGRYLAGSDQSNTQPNSFYGLRDGTKTHAFGNSSNQTALPSDVSFPITRSSMTKVSSLLSGATLSESTPMGWYYDLVGVSKAGITERVINSLQANDGVVSWIGSISNDDPCSPGGGAKLYSVQYGTGQTVLRELVAELGSPIEWQTVDQGLAGITLLRVGSGIRIMGTDVTGASKLYGSTIAESDDPRVVNWRIIRE